MANLSAAVGTQLNADALATQMISIKDLKPGDVLKFTTTNMDAWKRADLDSDAIAAIEGVGEGDLLAALDIVVNEIDPGQWVVFDFGDNAYIFRDHQVGASTGQLGQFDGLIELIGVSEGQLVAGENFIVPNPTPV